jgi:hypothetical protein
MHFPSQSRSVFSTSFAKGPLAHNSNVYKKEPLSSLQKRHTLFPRCQLPRASISSLEWPILVKTFPLTQIYCTQLAGRRNSGKVKLIYWLAILFGLLDAQRWQADTGIYRLPLTFTLLINPGNRRSTKSPSKTARESSCYHPPTGNRNSVVLFSVRNIKSPYFGFTLNYKKRASIKLKIFWQCERPRWCRGPRTTIQRKIWAENLECFQDLLCISNHWN